MYFILCKLSFIYFRQSDGPAIWGGCHGAGFKLRTDARACPERSEGSGFSNVLKAVSKAVLKAKSMTTCPAQRETTYP